jgi:hypothetical protein
MYGLIHEDDDDDCQGLISSLTVFGEQYKLRVPHYEVFPSLL